jgi:hypothetical protein
MRFAAAMLFTVSAVFSSAAATLPFRSGEILAAELSTAKPKIVSEDPLAFPLEFSRRIYAALVVKPAEGRGLSIHDYALSAFGRDYPCIALRVGDGDYNANVWEVKRAAPGEKYTLLFVLDATLVGLAPKELLTLRSLYPPKSRAAQVIPFSNLGGRGFTSSRSIPDGGLMKKAGEQ